MRFHSVRPHRHQITDISLRPCCPPKDAQQPYSPPLLRTPDCRGPSLHPIPAPELPTSAPFQTHHMLIDERGPGNQMSWKEIKRLALRWGVRLGSLAPRLPEACLWSIKESLMKHGEGITLTLTGRCPALCRGTINNMAASHVLAWERGVPSGSSVLTAVFGEFFFLLLFPPLLYFLPFSKKRYFRTGAIKSFLCLESECLSAKPGYFRLVLLV